MISEVPILCPIVPYAFPVIIVTNDKLEFYWSNLAQLQVQPFFGFLLRVQTLFWAIFARSVLTVPPTGLQSCYPKLMSKSQNLRYPSVKTKFRSEMLLVSLPLLY